MADYVTPPFPTGFGFAAEKYAQANARINADPVFNAQLATLLKHCDGIPEARLRMYAGEPLKGGTAGELNETAMQCFRSALPHGVPEPEELADKVEAVVTAQAVQRKASDNAFKDAWANYIVACQARKQRIAQAEIEYRLKFSALLAQQRAQRESMEERHAQEAQVLADELLQYRNEPVPEAPKRGA